MHLLLFFYLVSSSTAISSQNPLGVTSHAKIVPLDHATEKYESNIENAKNNARNIFNTIHSAKRQWGSSVQHNGMSLIPAIVPEGTLLYHGDTNSKHVRGMEWLAFEIQHAEMFAAPRPPFDHRRPGQKPFAEEPRENHRERVRKRMLFRDPHDNYPDPSTWIPGHLHIYRANRELRLLYLDGMAAANCDRGTYDTQTYILMENKTTFEREFENAQEMCEMASEWGVDGIIRMEIGFEIIYCEFQNGLDLVNTYQSPRKGEPEDIKAVTRFETVRETAQRYHGIDSRRLILIYSNMISAYFYPVNLTNPVPGNEDPRLVFTDQPQLTKIKSDLVAEIGNWYTGSSRFTDWQSQVVDMITARYSDRLKFMATDLDHEQLLGLLNTLLNMYVDYNKTSTRADHIRTCSQHYLLPVTSKASQQDNYLYAAVETVMTRICSTLFQAWDILIEELNSSLEVKPSSTPQELIQRLNEWLDWPDWKLCGKCEDNEVCFIAMFPFGTVEDHYFPRCANESDISNPSGNHGLPGGMENYWWSWRGKDGEPNHPKPEPPNLEEDL